jgi:competence protein ComEC
MWSALTRFGKFNPCFLLALLLCLATPFIRKADRPETAIETALLADVTGWVCGPPQRLKSGLYFELQPTEIIQGERVLAYPGRIAVYVYGGDPKAPPEIRFGEKVGFRTFLEDPSYYAIPGVPDNRQRSWQQQGVLHVARLKSEVQLQRLGWHGLLLPLRPLFSYAHSFEKFCWRHLELQQLKVVLCLFLGRNRLLEETDRIPIRRLGVLHVFVVSGTHVSLVLACLHLLLRLLGRRSRLATLTGLWSYVLIVGATIPVVRAGLMATVIYLLLFEGLKSRLMNVLGISALTVLAWHPQSLYTSSFQLSYLSICAIGLFVLPSRAPLQAASRGLRDAFTDVLVISRDPAAERRRFWRYRAEEKLQLLPSDCARALTLAVGTAGAYLSDLALCSWWIQLLILPVCLHHTNLWVWTQWLTNLLLVPFLALLVPLSLITFLLFWTPAGSLLGSFLGCYADGVLVLMQRVDEWALVRYLPQPGLQACLVYLVVFTILACTLTGWRRFAILLCPMLLFLFSSYPYPPKPSDNLVVTMLDVGQGESLHIQYPDGSHALIDTGGFQGAGNSESRFVGERLVSRYLWHQGVRSLRYVLITHSHADHAQGFDFVKDAFPIGALYYSDFETSYAGYRRMLEKGDRFCVGRVDHLVLSPEFDETGTAVWPQSNNRSLVVLLRHGQFTMLLTGDIEAPAEQALLPLSDAVTVLKVPHHGARTSSTPAFVAAAAPRLAFVSAGRRNSFGHPSPEVLNRYREAGVQTFTTPEFGSLRVCTDGRGWSIDHYPIGAKEFLSIRPGSPLEQLAEDAGVRPDTQAE